MEILNIVYRLFFSCPAGVRMRYKILVPSVKISSIVQESFVREEKKAFSDCFFFSDPSGRSMERVDGFVSRCGIFRKRGMGGGSYKTSQAFFIRFKNIGWPRAKNSLIMSH